MRVKFIAKPLSLNALGTSQFAPHLTRTDFAVEYSVHNGRSGPEKGVTKRVSR